jgi:hypothetical protein
MFPVISEFCKTVPSRALFVDSCVGEKVIAAELLGVVKAAMAAPMGMRNFLYIIRFLVMVA